MFRISPAARRLSALALGGACASHSFVSQPSMCAAPAAQAPSVKENYAKLEKKLHDIDNLNGVSNLLGWDEVSLSLSSLLYFICCVLCSVLFFYFIRM